MDEAYRRSAIRAAKELYYGGKVLNKIKNAESDVEISRIMHS